VRQLVWLTIAACGRLHFTAIDDACVPESDAELCAATPLACESAPLTDRCGVMRTVDCGACAGTLACVDHQCQTPLCATSGYVVQPLASVSLANTFEGLGAVTPDGDTVVWFHDTSMTTCGAVVAEILDDAVHGSFSYVHHVFDPTTLGLAGDYYELTPDGLTVIGPATDHRSLVAATRSGRMVVDFAASPAPWLAAIDLAISNDPTAQVQHIAISPDGEAFYYTISGSSGPLSDGIYEAVRASTNDPFPAGTRMSDAIQQGHTWVDGVSADHMTLLLDTCPNMAISDCWYTELFTRRSRNDPFTNPSAPAPPPRLPPGPGFTWSHRALADCTKMLAVASAGGCVSQDIVLVTRQ
jgi:hypothetical protein